MSLTTIGRHRPAAWLLALAIAGACTAGADRLLAPSMAPRADGVLSATTTLASPGSGVVISQVYGGGGNSGATLKNDFIELYNGGAADVVLDGGSVQYASATGSNWQVTPLSGTIQVGHYYLIQEAAGTGGTVSLQPDLVAPGAGISMAAGAGKVALVGSIGALAGTGCPLSGSPTVVDYVGYGTGTSGANCFEGAGPVGSLSATQSALRKDGGRQDTNVNSADFTVTPSSGVPLPRNGSTPPLPPLNVLLVSIAPSASIVPVGTPVAFTASATKGGQPVVITSATWSSTNTAVATIDPATGAASALTPGTTTIGVAVTTAVGTASASTTLGVSAPTGPSPVVISQVYGGGGNSGATLKNDYIQLYNGGTTPAVLDGWSVQYSSAAGAGWLATTKTNLSGTIPAGHYFLIQEGAGAGGSVDLVAPDFVAGAATGTNAIAIGAANGKIALVRDTTVLSGACPTTNPLVVDFVGYGSADCFQGAGATPVLSNTTAALRKDYGRANTHNNAADFEADVPVPSNSTSAPPVVGPVASVVVTPATWSMIVGQTKSFIAKALDANGNRSFAATFTWASDDQTVVAVDAAGVATGKKVGSTKVRATTADGKAGEATVDVTPVAGTIAIQARTNGLPVGFQTQLFLVSGGLDGNGAPVGNGNVTWSSAAPTIASINPTSGVVTAHGTGTVSIKAVATSDGITTATTSITVTDPSTSATARTGHNTDLGVPTDADPSDDIIIARRQYTTSYNPHRGVTNWVSWNLDATHTGSVVRCNCFSADTALVRLGFPAYETSDWINNGSNGQYSRGHMSPSADWQVADGDNAPTFFLTNMLPQNQDMNAGPWGDFENYLRTRTAGGAELYIVSGGIFTKDRHGPNSDGFGTISNAGKIAIPDSIWKVAVIVPDGRPVGGITSPSEVEVIAINTPNETPAPGATYATYYTTIDRIQKSTGYDLLSILPEAIQCRLEARNCAPTAHITGAGLAGGAEGQSLAFDGSTSSDPEDGSALRYQWSVDGRPAGTEARLGYTFTTEGTHQVALVVTDNGGAANTATAAVTVAEVAPTVGALAAATIDEGSSYAATGSFTDPGDDHWTATVDYGDGSGAQPLALAGKTFALAHTYGGDGTYQVRVVIADGGGVAGIGTGTVTVNNVAPSVAALRDTTILRGESYASSGSFADPGSDTWSATVDYGDGAGAQPLTLAGKSYVLQYTYGTPGVKTVRVTVTDGAGTGTSAARVTVLSSGQGVAALASTVSSLAAAGRMDAGDAKWLGNKLDVAGSELAKGNVLPARNQLQQLDERIAAALAAGRLAAGDAADLTAYVNRLLASLV